MKRARITYLIALPAAVLVLAGAAYATASANTDTGRSAADQVRTAERTLLRAELDADTHTAGRLLAPGFQLIDVTGTANTRADYLAAHEKAVAEAQAALRSVTEDQLMKPWRLLVAGKVVSETPRHEMLRDAINHLAHHRGQMTVYLRLMGAKVPALYGPSADDQHFG